MFCKKESSVSEIDSFDQSEVLTICIRNGNSFRKQNFTIQTNLLDWIDDDDVHIFQ